MQVSLESLSDIERKLTILLSSNDIQNEVDSRIKDLAPKVQISGFRPGKVPLKEVKSRFSGRVRQEVIQELMQKSLQEAIESHQLKLAGYPKINISSGLDEGDVRFEASVQVYPEIKIVELNGCDLEIIEAQVKEADVKEMLEQLRQQHRSWNSVDRAAQEGDQLNLDFTGYIDEQLFAGGEAKNFKVVLGEKKLIDDFEKGLIGHKAGDSFDLDVQFPADYAQKDLASKKARFAIKIHDVQFGELPELNDEFANKLGIQDGVEGLKKDIKQNMQRELKKKVSQINRKLIFDKFITMNPLKIPSDLIDLEIKNLQHDFYHRVFGHEHKHDEKIPDFPKELFIDEATRRVHLSLLYAEYLKLHALKVESDKVEQLLDELVSAYEDSQAAKEWYLADKNRMEDLENLLLEEMVADRLLQSAQSVLKKMSFRETMDYGQGESAGEKE